MKFNLATFCLGGIFFGVVGSVIDFNRRIIVEGDKFEDRAKIITITDPQTMKKDTFALVPLHTSKSFNAQIMKKIENGKVKVVHYNGPKP